MVISKFCPLTPYTKMTVLNKIILKLFYIEKALQNTSIIFDKNVIYR